jgi:flagellar basal-body rod protein FlgB
MDLFDSTQNLLAGALRGAAARQSALAENLANANTPGYRRVDVDFHDVLRAAADGGSADRLAQTDFTPQVDQAARMRLDGGTVDLDVEASSLAANGLEYQALVAVAQGRLSIVQSALGIR